MSLPDTIFIFLLALMIFGPKKLPEMAKQLGRLMGEFRRASNDFKFQIEEELRQADITEREKNPSQLASITQPPAIVPAIGAEPRSLPESDDSKQTPNLLPENTSAPETSTPIVAETPNLPATQTIPEATEVETTRG